MPTFDSNSHRFQSPSWWSKRRFNCWSEESILSNLQFTSIYSLILELSQAKTVGIFNGDKVNLLQQNSHWIHLCLQLSLTQPGHLLLKQLETALGDLPDFKGGQDWVGASQQVRVAPDGPTCTNTRPCGNSSSKMCSITRGTKTAASRFGRNFQGSTLCSLRLLLNPDPTLQCLKAWTLNRQKHEKASQHVPSHNAEGPSLFCVRSSKHIMGSLALTCMNLILAIGQPHFNGKWAAARRPVTSGPMRNHHPLEGGHLEQRSPQLVTENG